ncbi:methyl-accepting chemotaxis protein [Geothermobacter ehrlichii]|uniref:Methyl-accepting chemotaxis protein n=1 Tax=Geothermobacter ehrlichii TaxID=213224 RepID=A0A5D3WK08_9BACT|nr:methyl-accepting chemotaxis protein [Geothermobacter ehrlichii]TYO98684.1 methyl-accepting chemotaxis protein [Geothermobacter ehrlichii]
MRSGLSHRAIRNFGLGLLVIIIMVMVGSGIYQASTMDQRLQTLETYRQHLESADAILTDFLDIRGQMTSMIIEERSDPKLLLTEIKQLQAKIAELQKQLPEDKSRKLITDFGEKLGRFRVAAIAYLQEMALGTKGEGIRTWGNVLLQLEKEAHQIGAEFKAWFRQQIRDQNRIILANANRNRTLVILFGGIGAVVAVFIAFLLHNALARPIRDLVRISEAVAEGDLTREVNRTSEDELGLLADAIGTMVDKLRGTVRSIQHSARQVGNTARELDRCATQVSQGADEQTREISTVTHKVTELETIITQINAKVVNLTDSLNESKVSAEEMAASIKDGSQLSDRVAEAVQSISSSMAQMHSLLGQNLEFLDYLASSAAQMRNTAEELADSSDQVGRRADESAILAARVAEMAGQEGSWALDQVARETARNREEIISYRSLIHSLGKKSSSIGDILAMIRSVAERTNLLALNAAIIAAQAGEHGRSFAVVADEIRNLSETTTGQINQIEQVIEGVQNELGTAVSMIERVIEGADASISAVDQARQTIAEIVDSSGQAGRMAREIAEAAAAQRSSSQNIRLEISRNSDQVREIKEMIAEQKKGSDQIVAATEELREIAEWLKAGTREQAEGSAIISRTLNETYEFSREIASAMDQERAASKAMVESLQSISDIAKTNLNAMKTLGNNVDQLRGLADQLLPEVSRFLLPEETTDQRAKEDRPDRSQGPEAPVSQPA